MGLSPCIFIHPGITQSNKVRAYALLTAKGRQRIATHSRGVWAHTPIAAANISKHQTKRNEDAAAMLTKQMTCLYS
jgi:hypothetical protein